MGHKSQMAGFSGDRILNYSPCNDASRADTLSALSYEELASLLDGLVNVVSLVRAIWNIVVCYVVEAMQFEKLWSDDPRAVFDDLVHPLTVSHRLGALLGRHDGQSLAHVGIIVAGDAHDESCVGKGFLRLFKLAHVPVDVVSTRVTLYA